MYAIVQDRGMQYRVEEGKTLRVALTAQEPNSTFEFDHVLLVGDGDKVQVGTPHIAGARVVAKVLGMEKGDKIIVFKYRNKKRYRRRTGHRTQYTNIRIDSISLS